MRAITLISAAVVTVAGCSSERVVSTGEWATIATPSASVAPSLPATNPALLANAFDYVAHPNGEAAYYFASPSGRWQCAILPRAMAGCQSASGALGIVGAPQSVPTAAGVESRPNAVVIEPQGDAHFAALDKPGFTPPEAAKVLPFNRTLIVARFRCNIQDTRGVSCLSEQSGAGFTFTADGFVPRYTEVPLDAP